MSIRQQAPGSDSLLANPRQGVTGQRIELIELHVPGHTLFINKNLEADRGRLFRQCRPRPQHDAGQCRAPHSTISTTVPAGTRSKSSATS
jgi:hypothetical protein